METPAELKHRLYKEAQAMVSYIADRGIDKELPEAALLKTLDLEADDRAAVPIGDVMALHHALARAVAPAFPETIEKLHEYRNLRGWWRRLAPLNSILWLIVASFVLAGLFGFGLSHYSHVDLPPGYDAAQAKVFGEPTPPPAAQVGTRVETPYFMPVVEYLQGSCRFSVEELEAVKDTIDDDDVKVDFDAAVREHYQNCQELRRPILLRIFLFFGALGMLGAAYSSIYDSFSYIREGRYDMRLASTYYVRIFLGGFSGILLAEPLSDFLEQGVLSSALLAFIGGFSAQLVYDLLTKLVDSVANMFREDRRTERQAILAQAEYGALGAIQQHDAAQRQNLATVLANAQQEPNAELRAKMMQDELLGIMSGEAQSPVATGPHLALVEQMQRSLSLAELSVHAAPLWPEDMAGVGTAASAASAQLRGALEAVQASGGSPADLAAARAALEAAGSGDLVTNTVADAMDALGGALSGGPLRAVAKGALAAGLRLDTAASQRWRHVAYRATAPGVSLVTDLSELGDFALPGGGVIAASDMLSTEADELFARAGGGFADRAAFDAALEGWVDAAVRRALASDWAALAAATGSTLGGDDLVAALDSVQSKAAARGGLQRLELLGSVVHKTTDPEATLARLLALVDEALAGEAS